MRFTIGIPITKIDFLEETLKSVDNQTFGDFEVIIRNNANAEDLKQKIRVICNTYLKGRNVKYYESKEQLNISDNFNKILEKTSGEYLSILSDDDQLDSDFLQEFNRLIEEFIGINVFHCRVKIVDENNQLINYTESCPLFESLADFLFTRLDGKRAIYLSDLVVNTLSLKRIGGFPNFPYGWGIDELTLYKLGDKGIAYTPKVLINYRINNKNFSNSNVSFNHRFQDLFFLENEIEKIIESFQFKNIIYPIEFLKEKNRQRIHVMIYHVFKIFRKSTNLFWFIIVYSKYAKSSFLSKRQLLRLFVGKFK